MKKQKLEKFETINVNGVTIKDKSETYKLIIDGLVSQIEKDSENIDAEDNLKLYTERLVLNQKIGNLIKKHRSDSNFETSVIQLKRKRDKVRNTTSRPFKSDFERSMLGSAARTVNK